MQLLALTPAEIVFLTAPSLNTPGSITPGATTADAARDSLQTRLTRKLAMTLTARLRLPVQVQSVAAAASDPAPPTPNWQPDAVLATLWLTRRLGGQQVTGVASFVPRSLLHTLDAALAECWLDAPAQTPPPALAWHIASDLAQARLAVQLPPHSTDMTRWAREVIRHG